MPAKTQYARYGDLNLAYQTVGEGKIDVVLSPSFVSHLEFQWTHPAIKSFFDHIASFSRLTVFDKAGTGLSDPVQEIPTLEDRAGEIEAVMDAASVERAALFGLSEGGPMAIYFAVTRPERVLGLVLFGSYAAGLGVFEGAMEGRAADPERVNGWLRKMGIDDPLTDEQLDRMARMAYHVANDWGDGKALKELVPNQGDEAQLGLVERLCASPGMARATMMSAARLDVVDLLESVRAPTLIVHATGDLVPIQGARAMARLIPGARLLEVEGIDHAPWMTDPDTIVGEIEEMLTGSRHAPEPTRALATVLFTDICGSTERAAELGDAAWRDVLERHDEITRAQILAAKGSCVKNTGDGFLATFGGPATAIEAAHAIRDELAEEGVEIRAGIHTGEIERIGDDVGGLAVHIAARVSAQAGAGEILVSRTVPDLVVGSGLQFRDRGVHDLKGVPGEWQLLSVADRAAAAEEDEDALSAIEIGSRREAQRPIDRVAATLARRSPGLMRTAIRLDPRYRRARAQGR
jgi:pimeloyl-ACP methyl ester carboxylesterase